MADDDGREGARGADADEAPASSEAGPAQPAAVPTPSGGAERDKRAAAARTATHLLVGGAAVVAAGLAITGTVDATIGGAITLAGWAGMLFGLHRFGRLGAA